jgi:aromatic-L-amino-acid decarboxylase
LTALWDDDCARKDAGGADLNDDPLALDPETMRQLGYRTVDMLVARLSDRSTPPIRRATPAEMADRLHAPLAAGPESFEELLVQLERDVLPFMSWTSHPGFFAFIPGAGTWPGALGDFVASALNVYAGCWMESAGPSTLELEVLGWFKEWVGFPASAAGTLTTGGSAANMTALACARERLAGPMNDALVAYVSDQAHSSLARAARILGFRPDQVRVLPVDAAFRLDPRTLAAALDADVRAGRTPLLVAASGGTTNTGSVDPLPELAALCRERGVWLHVDAAYGGFSVLTERGRAALAGIELADSLALDPHKWLYQPFECGCLLVRDGSALRRAFEITPDYLKDAAVHDGDEVNFSDLGLQLTRSTRSFKLWLSLRCFGLDAFRTAIDRALDLAELARRRVESSQELELAAPPSLGVVCFRRRFDDTGDEAELERRNAHLVAALEESGLALVSSTRLHGRFAIRLCVLSHTSGREHVEAALDFLERAPVEPGPAPAALVERHLDVTQTWVASSAHGMPASLHPLFAALTPVETERALALATRREAAAGETVVEQWDLSRDFFVIVSGTVEVRIDNERVNALGPGDFFGELAALEWGAGFGYPRLATVVATAPLRLLVYPDGALNELVAELPGLAGVIRAAVAERLARR